MFNNNVKKLRISNDLTLEDLANECNVNMSYIRNIEAENVEISKTMMKKFRKVFKTDSNQIEKNKEIYFKKDDGRFRNNEMKSIHRWYPYIEGFSEGFVLEILKNYDKNIKVYDPFNGSGTTTLTCAFNGVKSLASEINPLMRFIAKTKVNTVANIIEKGKLNKLNEFISQIEKKYEPSQCKDIKINDYINNCYIKDDYFEKEILAQIAYIKKEISSEKDEDIKDILKLALASIIVESSNMTRASDLRRKKDKELSQIPEDAVKYYLKKLNSIFNDIQNANSENIKKFDFISNNVKEINKDFKGDIDVIITSPPYVNGTNYFRNTKLELWILDLIDKPKDLKKFRTEAVTAGINNVSKKISIDNNFEFVEKYAKELDIKANDKRIPKLIRAYFSDMYKIFNNFNLLLKENGKIYFDIGDSQYYGVHVPVDKIIRKIAAKNNFLFESEHIVRKRKSRGGMTLSQKVLVFRKSTSKNYFMVEKTNENYRKKAISFMENLPYTKKPYSKRTWGNKWHSLCSYRGKLKPAIAHWLIKAFTKRGEKVLDPLAGVGTIPFEACLQGRIGIANDLSEMAYIVSKAKLNCVPRYIVENDLLKLKDYIEKHKNDYNKDDLPYKEFGFNKNIPDYFHIKTYFELLAARKYFLKKNIITDSESIILSSLLHVLHGNRPYALSRRSHPLTPYAPKGEFVYKNVIDKINNKLDIIYKKFKISGNQMKLNFNNNESDNIKKIRKVKGWENYKYGEAIFGNAFDLDQKISYEVDTIITSPPFKGSIQFYTQNWLRLWFAGWEPEDFKIAEDTFLESLQKNDLEIYNKFFNVSSEILKNKGKLIMHLGKSASCNMADELAEIASEKFKTIYKADENVIGHEKHGIKDKGATTHHQFLFLEKK